MRETFAKALAGDKAAEKRLFRYLFDRFRTVTKYRGYGDECEDLAQEACVIVLTKYRQLPPDTPFEPWAMAVLRNVIGNHLQRKGTVKKHVTSAEFYPDACAVQSIDADLRLRLIQCLAELQRYRRRYYEALRLIHDGYTADEISTRMGVSKTNLYTILNRSRKALKDCLDSKASVNYG